MRKSGFHVQRTSNELRRAIEQMQPTLSVSLAHDRTFWIEIKRGFPSMFLIGRLFENGQHWLNVQPRTWADQCAALMMPYDAFLTFNEPPQINNDEITFDLAARHDEWCCEFRRRCLELGYEAVALNIATGNLHRNAIANFFPNVCQEFKYIGIHEYSARCMWDQDPHKQRPPEQVPQDEGRKIGYWYCQRYRDWYQGIVQRWPQRAGQVQMVVTECGIAMGVIPGFGDVGWKGQVSEEQYVESLIWYFTDMNQDDFCPGGAIFMMGAGDPKWNSFETLPLAGRLLAVPESTASPPPGGEPVELPGDEPAPPPASPIEGEPSMRVHKQGGEVATPEEAQDLLAYHGVEIDTPPLEPGQKYFKIVDLWDKMGSTSFIMRVLREDGSRWGDIETAFWWPKMKAADNDIREPYLTDWEEEADIGLTDRVTGEGGPGMGRGAYHGEYDQEGPHRAWIRHKTYPCELLKNIGMIAGTNHRHFDCWWQVVTYGGDQPSPEPEPEPEPEPQPAGWTMEVERRPGIRLLIGILPRPGIDVTLVDPRGRGVPNRSGTKPEHGPGAFEFPIWSDGIYKVQFLDQEFSVEISNQTVVATFTEVETPEESQARLISSWLSAEKAQEIQQVLEQSWPGVFSVETKP